MDRMKILITGGSSDIGAKLLSRIRESLSPQASVVATWHRKRPEFAFEGLEWESVDFASRQSTEDFCRRLKEQIFTHFVQLQGNSIPHDSIESLSFETLDFNLNVNLLSTVVLLNGLIPAMKRAHYGRIVLMNTASSNFGGGKQGFGYGLAKNGVGYLTKHLAKYYTAHNILTNCVSPGLIATRFHSERLKRTAEDMAQRQKFVPLGKAGSPADVADLIYYLAFENQFISGENIKIDGADFI